MCVFFDELNIFCPLQKFLDVTVAEHGANNFNKIRKETHEYI